MAQKKTEEEKQFTKNRTAITRLLGKKGPLKIGEIAEAVGVEIADARAIVKLLVAEGEAKSSGATRATVYSLRGAKAASSAPKKSSSKKKAKKSETVSADEPTGEMDSSTMSDETAESTDDAQ